MTIEKADLSKLEISQSELKDLKERIQRLESQLEKGKITKEKEKAVKEEIKSYLKEIGTTPSFAPPVKVRDEAKEIKKFSKPEQVGALISLVFEKGLKYAIEVAKKLENPAVMDEFHDTLVDRYYHLLSEKNVIK